MTDRHFDDKLWSYCDVLRDESLEDLDNLPSPNVLAREIVEDLAAALAEFEAVAAAVEDQLGSSRSQSMV